MSSKRHLRRKMCGDKVRHDTKELAEEAFQYHLRRRHYGMHVYHCAACSFWHVGHFPGLGTVGRSRHK